MARELMCWPVEPQGTVKIILEDNKAYTVAALDINSFTPVRRLADCVGTIEVLQYQRCFSRVCRVCFASAPHTCLLNGDSSDTVGLTPQICKGNHDEPWLGYCPR